MLLAWGVWKTKHKTKARTYASMDTCHLRPAPAVQACCSSKQAWIWSRRWEEWKYPSFFSFFSTGAAAVFCTKHTHSETVEPGEAVKWNCSLSYLLVREIAGLVFACICLQTLLCVQWSLPCGKRSLLGWILDIYKDVMITYLLFFFLHCFRCKTIS